MGRDGGGAARGRLQGRERREQPRLERASSVRTRRRAAAAEAEREEMLRRARVPVR